MGPDSATSDNLLAWSETGKMLRVRAPGGLKFKSQLA